VQAAARAHGGAPGVAVSWVGACEWFLPLCHTPVQHTPPHVCGIHVCVGSGPTLSRAAALCER
jgi:hypothetical protein